MSCKQLKKEVTHLVDCAFFLSESRGINVSSISLLSSEYHGYSATLNSLYTIVGVEPTKRRVMDDDSEELQVELFNQVTQFGRKKSKSG